MNLSLISLINFNYKVNNTKSIFKKCLNIDLYDKDLLSIAGCNGTGKTTLIKCIANILKPESGYVFYNSSCSISYVPQDYNTTSIFKITTRDFILLNCSNSIFRYNNNYKHYYNDLYKLSDVFGILNCLETPIQYLSKGQLQKLLIIRALIISPNILILDEPTNHLDINSRNIFIDMVLNMKCIKCIIIASHDSISFDSFNMRYLNLY